MIDFEETVRAAAAAGASDIHLSAGSRPALRVNGRMIFREEPPLSAEEVDRMIRQCLAREKYEEFLRTGDVDAAAEFAGSRLRVNAFRQRCGSSLALRLIRPQPPGLGELRLPDSIRKVLELQSGLVLVTGPTGSGKSTTLAALIGEFNRTRSGHIITIEDPIEYLHSPGNCIVNQREVGADSASYARALRAALREDPDIILVGEMRDLESISIAVTAAETGHLVLSTLHTIGAAKTIDRLIDVFPPEQQSQIRTQLSMALRSVISQRLLPAADGKGRVAAFEMMFVNAAVANLIREGRTANIVQIIETGAGAGMITLERSIQELVRQGLVDGAAAAEYLEDGAAARPAGR